MSPLAIAKSDDGTSFQGREPRDLLRNIYQHR